ncbi:MAG: hypothetical protein LBG64_02475 [Pseudomonadales bacterium]|jgi:hypothetical protein|nr:hypothetical protein [Pseudomonadales bacterium]
MAKTKYKLYYDLMMEKNQQLFADFKVIHDNFQADAKKYGDAFHKEGRDVLDVIRSYERKLCSGMERTANGMYSNKVSEKFWDMVRKDLPLIDQIGVTVRQKNAC